MSLNEICVKAMVGKVRVYGCRLHQLEHMELGNVPLEAITKLLHESDWPTDGKQADFFEKVSWQAVMDSQTDR